MGHVTSGRDLVRGEMEWVRAFLIGLKSNQKQESKTVSGNQPQVNIVKLSGIVKRMKAEEKDSGFVLVDPQTTESRFIPCTIFKSEQLVTKLRTFGEGDYIQIVGLIRAWSKQVENDKGEKGFQNRVEVRISEIKNTGTVQASRAAAQKRFQSDEEPF